MLGFGALDELPLDTLPDGSSLAADIVHQVIELDGVEGVAYLVELYPFRRSSE